MNQQLTKFYTRLPPADTCARMEVCIQQLVRKEHLDFGRSIKLGLLDSRKQWMAGEITFGDGPYGDHSTVVQVLKAKVGAVRSLRAKGNTKSFVIPGRSFGMAPFLLASDENG